MVITWDLVRDAESRAHAHLLHHSLICNKILRYLGAQKSLRGAGLGAPDPPLEDYV